MTGGERGVGHVCEEWLWRMVVRVLRLRILEGYEVRIWNIVIGW